MIYTFIKQCFTEIKYPWWPFDKHTSQRNEKDRMKYLYIPPSPPTAQLLYSVGRHAISQYPSVSPVSSLRFSQKNSVQTSRQSGDQPTIGFPQIAAEQQKYDSSRFVSPPKANHHQHYPMQFISCCYSVVVVVGANKDPRKNGSAAVGNSFNSPGDNSSGPFSESFTSSLPRLVPYPHEIYPYKLNLIRNGHSAWK